MKKYASMVIVDMTDGFIEMKKFSDHYPLWARGLFGKMMQNICGSAVQILDNGGEVVLLTDERFCEDKILPEIQDVLARYKERVHYCKKGGEGVFDSNTGKANIGHSKEIFGNLRDQEILVSGVQTTACVLHTCRDLEGFGLVTSIGAGLTINAIPYEYCWKSPRNMHGFNNIESIFRDYESVQTGLSNSLERGGIQNKDGNLFDYLEGNLF